MEHSHLDAGKRIKLTKENHKILKTEVVLQRKDQHDLGLDRNSINQYRVDSDKFLNLLQPHL